jgi:hypothetical protein
MAAQYNHNSFIKNTSLIDGIFLDINTLPRIYETLSDESYIIEPEYDQRPEMLAFKLYGDAALWWVFALRNPDIILDPIRDFKSGTGIVLPSAGSVKSLGGNATTGTPTTNGKSIPNIL